MDTKMTEADKKFYTDIIEYYEEEGICPISGFDTSDSYAIITATIAMDDGIMRGEHYRPFMAYAKAYFCSKTYGIMPTGEIVRI